MVFPELGGSNRDELKDYLAVLDLTKSSPANAGDQEGTGWVRDADGKLTGKQS